MATTFKRWRIGGGGLVTDCKMSSDGSTFVIRTDVFGCYLFRDDQWSQLITKDSMGGDHPWGYGGGCYDVAFCDEQPEVLYMVTPCGWYPSTVYRSNDRGLHWQRTALEPMTVDYNFRASGPKLSVHPTDPDEVFVINTAGEMFFTLDGGETWGRNDGLPTGSAGVICHDPSDLGVVYAATSPNGVWRCEGDHRWERLAGSPDGVDRMVVDKRGRVWVTAIGVGGQNCFVYEGESWRQLEPSWGDGQHTIAVNPYNLDQVTIGSGAGNIWTSMDSGHTWHGAWGAAGIRKATDIPWLAWTLEDWMTSGNMIYDAREDGRLWFAEGIGVWWTVPEANDSRPVWTEVTRGNDELIVNSICKPRGSPLIAATQDRGLFALTDPDAYPETHGPDRVVSIRHAWHADYAKSDPSFLAYIVDGASGYSRDGGTTWTPFASQRPQTEPNGLGHLGGCIAASTPQNIVWCPANSGAMWFTLDGGETWALSQFPATVMIGPPESGWAFLNYQRRKPVCADEVEEGVFYAYNYSWPRASEGKQQGGFFRSTDGGETWEQTADGMGTVGSMGTGAKLAAVPEHAGHLFWTCGSSGPNPYDKWMEYPIFIRSKDGGDTWQRATGWTEAWSVAFGKAREDGGYPTVFVFGSRDGDTQPNIYRSTDDCATWEALDREPASLDVVCDIAGDMEEFGRVYVALGGSGVIYGHEDDDEGAIEVPPPIEPPPVEAEGPYEVVVNISVRVTSTAPITVDVSATQGE